jgi:hypothetical protein
MLCLLCSGPELLEAAALSILRFHEEMNAPKACSSDDISCRCSNLKVSLSLAPLTINIIHTCGPQSKLSWPVAVTSEHPVVRNKGFNTSKSERLAVNHVEHPPQMSSLFQDSSSPFLMCLLAFFIQAQYEERRCPPVEQLSGYGHTLGLLTGHIPGSSSQ